MATKYPSDQGPGQPPKNNPTPTPGTSAGSSDDLETKISAAFSKLDDKALMWKAVITDLEKLPRTRQAIVAIAEQGLTEGMRRPKAAMAVIRAAKEWNEQEGSLSPDKPSSVKSETVLAIKNRIRPASISEEDAVAISRYAEEAVKEDISTSDLIRFIVAKLVTGGTVCAQRVIEIVKKMGDRLDRKIGQPLMPKDTKSTVDFLDALIKNSKVDHQTKEEARVLKQEREKKKAS